MTLEVAKVGGSSSPTVEGWGSAKSKLKVLRGDGGDRVRLGRWSTEVDLRNFGSWSLERTFRIVAENAERKPADLEAPSEAV